MKACKICGECKPLEKFGRCAKARDGRLGTCNGCSYARKRRDPAKERARTVRWRKVNRDEHLEQKRAESQRRNRRVAEAEGREYRTQAEWDAYWATRKAAELEQRQADRRARVAVKPWRALGLSAGERYALRYRLDESFHIRELLRLKARRKRYGRTGDFLRSVLKYDQHRSRKLERDVGYGLAELRRHLERQFTSGMTWSSFTLGAIHIDHVVPLSLFDLDDPSEVRAAWGLSNLRPMWAADNLAKGAKRLMLL